MKERAAVNVNSVVGHPAEVSYELTLEQEDALEESIEQIARGEFVTAKALFDELRAIREQTSRGGSPSRLNELNIQLRPKKR